MTRNESTPLGLMCLVLLGLLCGCSAPGNGDTELAHGVPRTPPRKIVFIGIDGADWLILNPLIEQGRLPNMRKIVEGGASGPLRSIEPILSPLVWTTMATGKYPEDHGILNFTVEDPQTGSRVPITRLYRKVDALWNLLGDYERTVDVVGWLATYPAEPIRGTLVSDRAGYLAFASYGDEDGPPPGVMSPEERYDEIMGLLVGRDEVRVEELQEIVHVDRRRIERSREATFDPSDPINSLLLLYSTAQSHRKIARHLLEQDRPDFLAVYYELLDAACHLFMPFAPPRQDGVSEEDYRAYKDAVEQVYVLQDRILGEVLDAMDDDTVLLIASDHGFKSGGARLQASAEIGEGHAAMWHRLDGVVALYGDGIRPGHRIRGASVLDIAPTVLALSGLPTAEDMPGRVLSEAFDRTLQAALNPTRVVTLEREREFEQGGAAAPGLMDEAELRRLEALGYIAPENPDALNNLGQRYQSRGEFAKAIHQYERALAIRPGFGNALINVGICYGSLQRYVEAERSFLQAIEVNEADILAMNNLAVLYAMTERPEKARDYAEKALAIEPRYQQALVTLGSAQVMLGQLDKAEQSFLRALEIDPEDPAVRTNLDNLRGAR